MTTEQASEVQAGQAPTLVRGTAVAVDLAIAVMCACLCFALISEFTPLDSPNAKGPVFIVMIVTVLYIGIARSHLPSPGRSLFKLRVVQLAPLRAGRRGRLITVQDGDAARTTATELAVLVLVAASVASFFALGFALANTSVYKSAYSQVNALQSLKERYGAAPSLSRFPLALLIGKQRAFVQIKSTWGEHSGFLDVFLSQDNNEWKVDAIQESETPELANYRLSVADNEIPKPRP